MVNFILYTLYFDLSVLVGKLKINSHLAEIQLCKIRHDPKRLFSELFVLGKISREKKKISRENKGFNSGIAPQFGHLGPFFPADKNAVLRIWRKKILMMIIIVAMIILINILVILMIMMTKNTEKPTNIVNFG